ncbi:MAG TPA: DUF411 domain-containing protein [Gemmatimonadaceae bacterium]|nr:DUF411 domain-containing protein [Gemmatimonadaceae bacterium]
MTKRSFRFFAVAVCAAALSVTTAAAPTVATPKKPTITVYKDPNCGCCKNWIQHLIQHGYRVDAKDTPDMAQIKNTMGVPGALHSCHTAVVNGYLIEGHVPAADIDRLLASRPKVKGLAVPGMPMGSPGMEGAMKQRYQVLSFDKNGKTAVFASY